MKKCIIIVGQGVEDSEFIYPYYRIQEENYEVTVITHNNDTITAKHGLTIEPTTGIMKVKHLLYDLMVIP